MVVPTVEAVTHHGWPVVAPERLERRMDVHRQLWRGRDQRARGHVVARLPHEFQHQCAIVLFEGR